MVIADLNSDLGLLLVRAFIILFVVMDSPGNIPIFIALTKGMTKEERKKELKYAVMLLPPSFFYLHYSAKLFWMS